VETEIVGDVAQREAEALATQDQDQPSTVAAAKHARGAEAFRREQALGFIEADGTGRDAEFLGEVGDRVELAALGFDAVHDWPRMAAYSSRNSFLLSLPIRVLGSSDLKMICLGISILLRRSEMNFFSSSSVVLAPALSLTY